MSDFYYEVKPGTEAHSLIKDGLEMRKKWNSDEISVKAAEFLGVDKDFTNKNLYQFPGALTMVRPPEHLKDQFKKPNSQGNYTAKQALNKKWVEFCKENGLTDSDTLHHFRIKYGLFMVALTFWFFDDRFFIECKAANLQEQEQRDFLIPIEKVEFLKIHLAYEEKCKEEDASNGK